MLQGSLFGNMDTLRNQQFERLILDISENDFGICDNFLNSEQVQLLILNMETPKFLKAGIGKLSERKENNLVRGDEILWIEDDSTNPADQLINKINQNFIQYLNKTCYLGIKTSEMHYAKYPQGSFYKKHLDVFQTQNGRILTLIFYLNINWVPSHGGELIIYSNNKPITIEPLAGRLVCFKSNKLEHEVKETNVDRYSVTGWYLN